MRGGPRPGSGRPKGAKTVRTAKKISDELGLTGETPLEVLIQAMRFYQSRHGDRNLPLAVRLAAIDKAAGIARDAAPYMHPRLTATRVEGKDGGPVEFQDVSAREILAQRIALLSTRIADEASDGQESHGYHH
jgi:hypothetical protein